MKIKPLNAIDRKQVITTIINWQTCSAMLNGIAEKQPDLAFGVREIQAEIRKEEEALHAMLPNS